MQIRVDAVIFGGGAAGLWLIDHLRVRGLRVLLLESGSLGQGQTISAQGIIHGGLKYTLQGLLTNSATAIREMPHVWRRCLQGEQNPDLSETQVRSDFCYLWRTDSVSSRLGMIGARFGLRVAPQLLEATERPAVLAQCPGTVARLDEQVISTESFLTNLANRNRQFLLSSSEDCRVEFILGAKKNIEAIQIDDNHQSADQQPQHLSLTIIPQSVIFTAGAGNAQLLTSIGHMSPAMQLRPLQMVMLRGKSLPELNGHCVDGAQTRVTVTSNRDSQQRTVWQLGGQLAEAGVKQTPLSLLQHAKQELHEVLPGLDLSNVEGATYCVNRAERRMAGGKRPESVQISQDTNVITAWPTKMALAPTLAEKIAESLPTEGAIGQWSEVELELLSNWKKPEVASPPWAHCENWWDMSTIHNQQQTNQERVA